ncbi:hypothetical protein [Trichocoleus sp. FACHB-46]|nr:hypothetical protein [Trichocoleus sp. FACHB-46]
MASGFSAIVGKAIGTLLEVNMPEVETPPVKTPQLETLELTRLCR